MIQRFSATWIGGQDTLTKFKGIQIFTVRLTGHGCPVARVVAIQIRKDRLIFCDQKIHGSSGDDGLTKGEKRCVHSGKVKKYARLKSASRDHKKQGGDFVRPWLFVVVGKDKNGYFFFYDARPLHA